MDRGWRHCVCTTYGQWLPGDPRGFRTRHHREHVEGDYKSPPPAGVYEQRHDQSKQRLTRDPVWLSPPARVIARDAFLLALQQHNAETIAIAVCATHLHVLTRFDLSARKPTDEIRGLHGKRTSALDDPARHVIGIAKKASAFALTDANLVVSGGVWGKRGKIVAVRDRAQQHRVMRYITDHASEGAAVWRFGDPTPTAPEAHG